MTHVTRSRGPIEEALQEIDTLVHQEETQGALARLDRLEKQNLPKEERLAALLLRSMVYLQSQDLDALEESAQQVMTLAAQDSDCFEEEIQGRLLYAHYLALNNEPRRAVALISSIPRQSASESHRARVDFIFGLALLKARHFDWAIDFLEKAEAYYRWNREPAFAIWACLNTGLCYRNLADWGAALACYRRARRLLPSKGFMPTRFRVYVNEGVVQRYLGNLQRSRAAFVEVTNLHKFMSPLHESLVACNLGHTFRMQGNRRTAVEYYQESIRKAEQAQLKREICMGHYWLGQTWMEGEDLGKAEAALDEAERIADRQLKHGGLRMEVFRRRAELAAQQGDLKKAEWYLRKTLQQKKALDQPYDQALVRRTRIVEMKQAATVGELSELIQEFRLLGDRYEFTRTVLRILEQFDLAPPQYDWLAHAVVEARHYASVNELGWLERMDAAAYRTAGREATTEDFHKNREIFERSQIRAALDQTGGNVSQAARLLGVARNTLTQRMRTLRVPKSDAGVLDRRGD